MLENLLLWWKYLSRIYGLRNIKTSRIYWVPRVPRHNWDSQNKSLSNKKYLKNDFQKKVSRMRSLALIWFQRIFFIIKFMTCSNFIFIIKVLFPALAVIVKILRQNLSWIFSIFINKKLLARVKGYRKLIVNKFPQHFNSPFLKFLKKK